MAEASKSVIRAVFSCVGSKVDDIVVDLVVDHNRHWVENVSTSGWWGKPNSNDVWPFILKKGGVLDFGSNIDEPSAAEDRFGSLAISNKPLAKGASFHFCYGDISANFKLVKDDELATLG